MAWIEIIEPSEANGPLAVLRIPCFGGPKPPPVLLRGVLPAKLRQWTTSLFSRTLDPFHRRARRGEGFPSRQDFLCTWIVTPRLEL